MAAPIYDFLKDLSKKNTYPFHMPGHKRKELFKIFPYDFDITEIIGADNLHKPEGIIKEAQELMAKLIGAKESFFIVNGSSAALMSAVMSVCKSEDKILAARNCHRSVYNGILLSGAKPIYIYPETLKNSLIGGISPDMVEYALNTYEDIKAVILTNPTYEGFCSDIEKISKIVHKKNIPLIVDEAHGAHFAFSDYFPKPALAQGADIAVQSWHKTLPVLTQCSAAHINSEYIKSEEFGAYISIFQTTSPSYLFMSAIDKCRDILEERGEYLFDKYTKRLDKLRKSLLDLKIIKLVDNEILKKAEIADYDRGKLVFEINCDKNGNNLEKKLIKDYNLQIEMSSMSHIILMTSIMDTKKSYKKLKKALYEIDSDLNYSKKDSINIKKGIVCPEISPKESYNLKKRLINIEQSEKKISADFIIPYPPGIPILAPGEVIQIQDIEKIKEFHQNGIKIIGLNDNCEILINNI